MSQIIFRSGEHIPLEMHKVKMVQKLSLLPVEARRDAIINAGCNTFLMQNRDVFLDMLTDSGVNAMSDNQYAAMLRADDSYAGSETFYRLTAVLNDIFGMKYFLPAHQGRACENVLAEAFVSPGMVTLMNYHFTTVKAHITRKGGIVEEFVSEAGLQVSGDLPFKGDIDIDRLSAAITRHGLDRIAFARVEAGTNLIGGQPVSMDNLRRVSDLCRKRGVMLVYDASLLADNLYFIKTRDAAYSNTSINEITREIASLCDIIYFSGRKLGAARGGGILTSRTDLYDRMKEFIPLYEGFLTYGGMSIREMEAMAVGLEETMDMDVISQTPLFVEALSNELLSKGVPIVTPPGGLGCHLDAKRFCAHVPQSQFQAGALAVAAFIAGGIRGMERGTISEQREVDGSEHYAEMELLRLAVPKRVFTLSHIKYAADRITWLYENRQLIGGLQFTDEPKIMRFFLGRLAPVGDWADKLVAQFRVDFGDSL